MAPPTDLGVAALVRALRAGETTAAAVTEATLARIAAVDERAHAFVAVTADEARRAAAAADAALARGTAAPLAGVPVAVKDLIGVRGLVRGCGSAAFANDPPQAADAGLVARLRAAGAVVVGTLHLHECAHGSTGVNPALGTPVNPWDPTRVPGGSSSGSGVAVAAGLVPAAIGSDTGGSIRLPASFCGITGLKPTYGRVGKAGVMPLAWTLDHVGPMTRTVEDAALVLQVIAGHDPADPTSARLPVPDYAAALAQAPRGLRVGVPRGLVPADVDRELADAFAAALAALERLGMTVREVDLGDLPSAQTAFAGVFMGEAAAALGSALGERLASTGADLQTFLQVGRAITARHYLASQRQRARLWTTVRAAMADVDLLASPTTILPPPPLDQPTVRVDGRDVWVVQAIAWITWLYDMTGQPAISVPCGFTAGGLPLGLQLAGRPFAEADVLRAAHAYQQATDWHLRRPPEPR